MDGRTYIGIDLGTSGVKLLLMDDSRNVLAQSSLEYEASHPQKGWAEIDPEIWYDRTLEGLRRLLSGQNPERVSVIGVTGQMHTLVLLDRDGGVLRPAMMWNDKRTAGMLPFLRSALAEGPDGEYLSGIVSTGSPAANMYWLSREEPENFRRLGHFLIGPDYLVYRLTGNIGTDFVEASTSSLYLIHRREWSPLMMELTGLSKEACPPVRGCGEIAGTVIPELASALGLSENVLVITGTGDNPATAFSTGCIGGGYPVLSLGTSGVLVFPASEMGEAPKGKVILCSVDGKDFFYLVQGTVQSTGESISWWNRSILGIREYGTLDALIDDDMIRRSGVLFYPHINGDKTIYGDPSLRGAFIGLGSETDRAEMYFAVIEGLCFAFRQLSETVGLDLKGAESLRTVGGGSRSDVWMRILANVLDVKIERLGGTVGPARGIALLAWKTDHPEKQLKDLTEGLLRTEKTFTPEKEIVQILGERYKRYLRIHDAVKSI